MADSSVAGSEVSPNFVFDEESKTLTVRHVDTLHVGNVDTVHVGDIHHHVSESVQDHEDCDGSTSYKEMEVDTNIEPIHEPVTTGEDEAGAIDADPRVLQHLQKLLSNYHNPGKWENNQQMCLELVSLFELQAHAFLTKVRFDSVYFFVRVKLGTDHDAFLQACTDGTLSRGLTKLLVTPELEKEVGVKLGVRLEVKKTSNTNNVSALADMSAHLSGEGNSAANQAEHEIRGTRINKNVSQEQLDKISKKFPNADFESFSKILGIEGNEANNILTKHSKDYRKALMEILMAWKNRTCGPCSELEAALSASGAKALIADILYR